MRNIEFQNIELTQKLFGYHNTHLEKISAAFNLTINSRGKSIVTGDISQSDLPTGKRLIKAKDILTRIKGIDFITFSKEDVVRHPLVSNIY